MKVLVAIPTAEMARYGKFYDYVNMLQIPKGVGNAIMYSRGSSPAAGRNILISLALQENFTHIFFLDDDLAFPPDIIQRLAAHDKDMVTGLYLLRNHPHRPIIFDAIFPDGAAAWHFLENGEKGLIPIKAAGLGCCLIKTEIFNKLEAPYIRLGQLDFENWNDDIEFFNRTDKAGIELYCDLDLFCGHMGTVTTFPHRTDDGKWLISYDTMGKGRPSFLMEPMSEEEKLERKELCLSV